jgi:hypothetical protein
VTSRRKRHPKATSEDLDLTKPVELVALSVKQRVARCRVPGTERIITLRASGLWELVPGEIVAIKPKKQWSNAGHPYLSGKIESTRLDVAGLGLVPLKIREMGIWDPEKHYWGEEDEPIEEWAKPIIAKGPRPEFEVEQVLPGQDPEDPFSDPITESNDLKDTGNNDELAHALLTVLANHQEPENLRCQAVISLGPPLEHADMDGREDSGETPIKEDALHRIQETFFRLYMDSDLPKEVRRHVLETSVRAPQSWHEHAVREAYDSKEEAWKLTAVFCMRFIPGFDSEILESLESAKPDIH